MPHVIRIGLPHVEPRGFRCLHRMPQHILLAREAGNVDHVHAGVEEFGLLLCCLVGGVHCVSLLMPAWTGVKDWVRAACPASFLAAYTRIGGIRCLPDTSCPVTARVSPPTITGSY